MPGRRPRWKRGDKFAEERCGHCGGRDFIDAIDNDGERYRGCSRCTIHLPSEVLVKLQEEGLTPPAGLVRVAVVERLS